MKFTLTQKGIILVSIPLLFEFLFVGVLYFLLAQAEEESARVFQSANIDNCSNKLIKDVFELSAIGHSELAEIIEKRRGPLPGFEGIGSSRRPRTQHIFKLELVRLLDALSPLGIIVRHREMAAGYAESGIIQHLFEF